MDERERELWRRADVVLDELLDLPETEREPRLLGLTPDETVRSLVRRLLVAHSHPHGPLDAPAPALALPASALSGQRLGRWRLHDEIGRGGMAVVYRAVAEDGGEGQLAAVKVLTLGSLAQRGHERFLQEQQVLLRLRHPYLATLYEAGVADDGTPWLAMALVEGEPIDAWCRERELDAAARVRLVIQVCEAIAYAHANLVIHRDIKPSNVLVDRDGIVRVLDFGIARLLDEAERERTATMLRALTPEYAAPEQFHGALPSTAMDVFGIGALAYRLLAGTAPRLAGRADDSTPITPPSRALRRGNGDQPHPELRERVRRLRGDLDTILMKALAERPGARYASVEALASDLRRWLEKKPVHARPPTWRYRFERFVARNRAVAAMLALLALALAGGVGGVLWQAAEARKQAAHARAAAEASQAQTAYLASLLQVLAPSTPAAREIDRAKVIAEAARRANAELDSKPQVLASVEMSLANVAEEIGDYPQAAALYDAALARRQRSGADQAAIAEALARSGSVRSRLAPTEADEGLRRVRDAVALLRTHAPDSPLLVDALMRWGRIMADVDRYPEANASLDEADRLCSRGQAEGESCEQVWLNQGAVYRRLRDGPAALRAIEKAYAARRLRLGEEHADTLLSASQLAQTYIELGRYTQALALLERVHATQQRIFSAPTQETLDTLHSLIQALQLLGHGERALLLRTQYLERIRGLLGEEHPDVALGYADLGSQFYSEARFAEAEAAYAKALALYGARDPDGAATLITLGNHADALRELGRAREALPLQRRALAGMERLFGRDNLRVATRYSNLARTRLAMGQVDAAIADYDRAIALYRKLEPPDHVHSAVAGAFRGRALLAAGRAREAEAELRAQVQRIDASPARTVRTYWESYAFLIEAACANRATDCGQLRHTARAALSQPLPGIARKRIEVALEATRPHRGG